VTLLFGSSTPPGTHISVRVFPPWAERINQQGKGVVKIDIRDGMEIANPGNFHSRVRQPASEKRSVNQIAEDGVGETPPLFLDQRVIGAAPRQ
jgi:hypothetical protein